MGLTTISYDDRVGVHTFFLWWHQGPHSRTNPLSFCHTQWNTHEVQVATKRVATFSLNRPRHMTIVQWTLSCGLSIHLKPLQSLSLWGRRCLSRTNLTENFNSSPFRSWQIENRGKSNVLSQFSPPHFDKSAFILQWRSPSPPSHSSI